MTPYLGSVVRPGRPKRIVPFASAARSSCNLCLLSRASAVSFGGVYENDGQELSIKLLRYGLMFWFHRMSVGS